jgi:radical SAM superfamily enzyme YgiQ (UPF0313 family)
MINRKRFRFRMIVPSFANLNVYSFTATTTTSVGPIYVATAASKLENWDVEVIDENNCHGRFVPRDKDGKLDHSALQKDRPADVVGFYGSISSTIPNLFKLAKQYKEMGALTVSGGKHVENLPEEALKSDIDVVAHGDGEITIKELLMAWEHDTPLQDVDGISFMNNDEIIRTKDRELIHDFDQLPQPDFSLLRYAKMELFPLNRTRGCNSNCEFCAVKDKARCSSPQRLMDQIKTLVETHNARKFFEVSDHFAANRDEAIQFCNLLAEYQKKHKIRIVVNIQTRITDARYPELLEAMKRANIETVCIGFESPIDEELIAMRKGYLYKDLIEWTKIFHHYGFFIHGMFIFGYPRLIKDSNSLSLLERAKRFNKFIKDAKIDTVQILLTIPLPGTDLRKRLEGENRIYSLDILGWEYYDGQFPLYEPDDNIAPEEVQKAVLGIMKTFYNFRNFWKIVKNILVHFPRIVFTSTVTLLIGRVRYVVKAFIFWYKGYYRNQMLRFGGFILLTQWIKKFRKDPFLEKLDKAKKDIAGENFS